MQPHIKSNCMVMQKLRLNFARFTDSGILTKARQILQDMTGNAYFANPIPTLADLQLASSGFDLAKQREVAVITNPGSVTLGNGISTGQLTTLVQAQAAAKGYSHEYTLYPVTPASVWTSNPSSRCKTTFTGLEPGKKYAVRVGVLGNNEELAYSGIATMYVQ